MPKQLAKTIRNARIQDQPSWDNHYIPAGHKVEIDGEVLSDGSIVILYLGFHHVVNYSDLEVIIE